MIRVDEPKVFLIGSTHIENDGLQAYLDYKNVPDWQTNAPSDAEKLIEVYGRGCYQSFGTDLNPNISRVREGNGVYLDNIKESAHGSVSEHPVANFMIVDASRVFTHELVRHRVGTAFSQESLRYVVPTNLKQWLPSCFLQEGTEPIQELFSDVWEKATINYEAVLKHIAVVEGVDDFQDLPFSKKKEYTSATRRLLPIGLGTDIGFSVNLRAARHLIEMRTNKHSEEEIRVVFSNIAVQLRFKYPNWFDDYDVNSKGEWITQNRKI